MESSKSSDEFPSSIHSGLALLPTDAGFLLWKVASPMLGGRGNTQPRRITFSIFKTNRSAGALGVGRKLWTHRGGN
jgi:hypothetical protein